MAGGPTWSEEFAAGEGDTVVLRRPGQASDEIDMTPMIDCVFLLLIFFLVGSTPDLQTAVELPPAQYGTGVSPQTSVVVTLAEPEGKGPAKVYLADGKVGSPLSGTPAEQETAVQEAVEQGFREGKPTVLIKAEKNVRHREVARFAAAAARVEGVKLFVAVFELR
ncbi:MAG: biopolymer transporter ExbD [Planctomycetota bacterium]